MTSTQPTEAERIAKAMNIALTERQIGVACIMWRDPQKWKLVFAAGLQANSPLGTRCIYVRKAKNET